MAEDTNRHNEQNNEDVRREDLKQKHEGGRDATRTGSTGSDILTSEWKPGDEEQHRTENPKTGSTGSGSDDREASDKK